MSECNCGSRERLPEWFRQEVPDQAALAKMRGLLQETKLRTVCEGAHCPNMGACWKKGTASFMILGDVCTRACRFCAVTSGVPTPVDFDEPLQVADAVGRLGLQYVVVTSVTRDDLADGGAGQFARTIRAIRAINSGVQVEVLTPDFHGDEGLIKAVLVAEPDVFGHNIETVRRLSPVMRSRAEYERSLGVLRSARKLSGKVLIKSGIMVGMGESDGEVLEALQDLKNAGCDIVTIGQYLAPSQDGRHLPVARFVAPDDFVYYREEGLKMGLKFVHSAPLVRSSYLAEEGFQCCHGAEGAST